jgi:protein-S-isoprenylcysteine O-methyltransferase
MSVANVMAMICGFSELGLLLWKRSGAHTRSADAGSLRILWVIIAVSMTSAFMVAGSVPTAWMPNTRLPALILFPLALALRWYSILYLGRFFTVDVAIANRHEVIDSGPYRAIRHPSYTGLLLEFAAIGLGLSNWLSLAVILVPTTAALLWRVHVEEAALTAALGTPYREYRARTKKLIPLIY